MESMDPRILEALRSDDPEERKKGVRALGQNFSNESLRYLATIYKRDPDYGVRRLAIHAGRHVKKMRAAGDWMADNDDKDVRFMTSEQPAISTDSLSDSERQAKGLMDRALDESIKQDFEKAEVLVRQAFKQHPDLKNDPYYVGIASDVLGMPAEEAIASLLKVK